MMMTREWRTFSSTLGSSKRATMNWPRVISRGGVVFLMALTLAGCQSSSLPYASPLVVRTIEPSLTIPVDVQRIAVFYPRSSNSDFLEAYQRLEGATFQLKILRPTLKVVDRVHLLAVITEQHFQVTGAVADDGAVRVGHLLGVDSVLLYSIDGPTLRDRFFARVPSQVRPITVTTKIIRVESGEVVYLNVVTARMEDEGRWDWSPSDNWDYQQLSRAALERGIIQTVSDLQRAFE
jgi:hypothetical protein